MGKLTSIFNDKVKVKGMLKVQKGEGEVASGERSSGWSSSWSIRRGGRGKSRVKGLISPQTKTKNTTSVIIVVATNEEIRATRTTKFLE